MLDSFPLTTVVFIVGIVLTVIAYLSNEITYLEATAAIGFTGVGTAAVGEVRNRAGRGVRGR